MNLCAHSAQALADPPVPGRPALSDRGRVPHPAHVAADAQDLLTLTVCTGLQFGEVTALWCRDIDLEHGTVRVNKALKRDGEDGETETPGWLKKLVRPKQAMRGHHLGNPKTPKSRRTVTIAPFDIPVTENTLSTTTRGGLT